MVLPERPEDPNIEAVRAKNRERREVKQVIDDIGMQDDDGNGLPDWLDAWLEDNGIVPADLPVIEPARLLPDEPVEDQ